MRTTLFIAAAMTALSAAHAQADMLAGFDVAEDHTRFVFAAQPVYDDGMPAYGNAFVTQGYIYPAGTLDGGAEGVNADGSPAFPDLVIGEWTCDGFFVGEGMRTTEGPIVMSRQIYAFEDGDLLVTHGPEFMADGIRFTRAVTGGTGDYADAPAELEQTFLGMSEGLGVRLHMDLENRDQAALYNQ
ncbi:MAG: hypothetical protein LJE62_15790 [Silicimonas sp.]|jgi:hypothetical protein|nr:hypothetical protein [Silicimonas sp.]